MPSMPAGKKSPVEEEDRVLFSRQPFPEKHEQTQPPGDTEEPGYESMPMSMRVRSFFMTVCETIQGYIFWSILIVFLRSQASFIEAYPTYNAYVMYIFICLVFPPLLATIPVRSLLRLRMLSLS